jgi:uncharacterized protein (DUF983 family)
MDDQDGHWGPVSPLRAGLACRCPRCGEGRLFAGYLTVAPRCEVCGLDLAHQDSGDGPAVFMILVIGFLVCGLALVVEVKYEPPTWVHMALWIPAILILTFGLIRPLKALMIALQYRHKAGDGEGREWD